jgi:uncharacterized protein involved in exopolysaccharide biosynthesis
MILDMAKTKKPDPRPIEVEELEIGILQFVKYLWEGRRLIIKTTIVFMILGFLIALFTPKQYTATSVMVPQLGDGTAQFGGLSSIAAIAGFNFDISSRSELSPSLYPKVVESVTFLKELMEIEVTFSNLKDPVNLYDYFTEVKKPTVFDYIKKYTISLPGTISKAIKYEKEETTSHGNTELLSISEKEKNVIKLLSKLISINVNEKEGYISLATNLSEPLAAAEFADKTQKLLQRYITEYKIEKAKADLDFVQQRYDEKKAEYEKAQENLAKFRDQNKNVATAVAKTEEERLSSEYQLAYSVLSELAKQLENYKIKVKEDTPVFIAINPVTIPYERTKPNRKVIVLVWTFIGGFMGVVIVLGKIFSGYLMKVW